MNLFVDKRDNEKYRVKQIDNLYWFCENLRYRHPNGVYYMNDQRLHNKYGLLYPYYDSEIIAPEGWRVATYEDYVNLVTYTGNYTTWDGLFEKVIEGGILSLDFPFGGYYDGSFEWFNVVSYFRISDKINYAFQISRYNNLNQALISSSNYSGNLFYVRCVKEV